MPEPLIIVTLISSLITAFIQCFQSYIDYKRDRVNNTHEIYEAKNYTSSCCNITVDSDNESSK